MSKTKTPEVGEPISDPKDPTSSNGLGKRLFWSHNANMGVPYQGTEIRFTKHSALAGTWRGFYITDNLGEILAITQFSFGNPAFKEVSAKELADLTNGTVIITDAAYKESVPLPITKPSTTAQKSFLEQTEWDAGLFAMPTPLDITVWYNCSIAEYGGKKWLFTRRHRYNSGPRSPGANQSDLEIFEVRKNMSLRQASLPIMPNRYPAEQWEDPRAVLSGDGSMYVSFATWVHHKSWFVRQSLCKLTKDWTRCDVILEPAYGGNSPVPRNATRPEKNWVFFEHAKTWHFVYSINPHIVVRPLEPGAKHYPNRKLNLPWTHGDPRGGTTPVRVGNEFLCFFHSSSTWRPPKRRYYMGAYTFSAVPPFELKRITPEPLLVGSEEDFRVLEGPLVIFPNGAVFQDDIWTVVFGVNDENCGWLKIPDAELQKKLLSVK